MKLPDDPNRVFAVIVGVERYAGNWPLRGPAMDALSMADWLLGGGVPGAQVRLFHNIAPGAAPAAVQARDALLASVQARGAVLCGEPTRAALEAALLTHGLVSLQAPAGSTLWLFWSGHGVLTDVGRYRHVLTSDASAAELGAINLDNLGDLLRMSPQLAHFAQQLLIVDACSTWSSRAFEPTAVTRNLSGLSVQQVRQERLYASVDGQRAAIREGEVLSLFSAQLLELLGESTLAGLDLDKLWEKLKPAVEQAGQPCIIDRLDPDGRPAHAVGGRAPAQRVRIAALVAVVGEQGLWRLDLLQRLFRQATRCDDDAAVPASLHDIVWQLDEMTPRPGALPNSAWFALRLQFEARERLRETGLPAARQALLEHNADALAEWLGQCDPAALAQDRALLEAESAAPSTLFVDLGPDMQRVWIRLGGHWRFVGAYPAHDDAAASLQAAWQVAIAAGLTTRDCHLDLAVGFDALARLPLRSNIATAARRPRRIGVDLPFSVRLRDRWQDHELCSNWLDAYDKSRALLDGNAEVDWLDERAQGACDALSPPNAWLGVHDLAEPAWLECLRGHLEDGSPWAIACTPCPSAAERLQIAKRARARSLRDWMRVARAMTELPGTGALQVVVLADAPDTLPPGSADRLQIPV